MTTKPINSPVRTTPGVPDNWVCNVRLQHIDDEDPCHCKNCMLERNPGLLVGEPVPTIYATEEKLISLGFVGLYTPPPPYSKHCPICGVLINLHIEVAEGSEVVHVRCLEDHQREVLEAVGYTSEYMIRRKETSDGEDNNSLVSGASDNKCEEEGSSKERGEPLQDSCGEESPLVEEQSEGPCESSRESGMDVQVEQTNKGAEEGSEQEGPRDSEEIAEES